MFKTRDLTGTCFPCGHIASSATTVVFHSVGATATYFVRVEGDSMVGAGISDGDLLVVDRSLRPADGDVVIASVDGDFTVKTYRRDKSGVRLEPANPNYPVIRLRPGQELDYFGKVTACIHRFAGKQ